MIGDQSSSYAVFWDLKTRNKKTFKKKKTIILKSILYPFYRWFMSHTWAPHENIPVIALILEIVCSYIGIYFYSIAVCWHTVNNSTWIASNIFLIVILGKYKKIFF